MLSRISFLLIVISLFLGPVCASQKIVYLPKPTGPYGVGVHNQEILDSSRTMLRSSEKRRWMMTIIYPCFSHNTAHPYMPGTLKNSLVQGTPVMSWAKSEATFVKGHKFPVIIFVPGRGAQRQDYTILQEQLASHGYVVCAMDQPYVASFVQFLSGEKIVVTLKDAWNIPRDRNYRYAYDDLVIDGAIKDVAYILNHPQALGYFADICDWSSVILMGHSLGGNVAHNLGFQDKRIQAIVDLDSKITERKVFGRIGVPPNPSAKPVLFIRSCEYQDDVGDQLMTMKGGTVWSVKATHGAFADNIYFQHKIKNFHTPGFASSLWNWFWKRGPHFVGDDDIHGQKVEDWYRDYTGYVVGWLGNILSKKER